MLLEIPIWTIAGWVFAPVCSALIVALVGQRSKTKEARRIADGEEAAIEKATCEILNALARQMIIDAYEKYIIHGEHLTIARYEELLRVYDAYKALGGNGTAEVYMKEVTAKKPYLVLE